MLESNRRNSLCTILIAADRDVTEGETVKLKLSATVAATVTAGENATWRNPEAAQLLWSPFSDCRVPVARRANELVCIDTKIYGIVQNRSTAAAESAVAIPIHEGAQHQVEGIGGVERSGIERGCSPCIIGLTSSILGNPDHSTPENSCDSSVSLTVIVR